jgi:hypothetical protein
MFADKLLTIILGFLGSAPAVPFSSDKYTCTKPAVRREWRSISTEDKAEWIRAVHVRIDARHPLIVFAEAYSESSACRTSLMTRL